MKYSGNFLLLVTLLFSACKTAKTPANSVSQKPNIIFIMTDDHARRAISLYENKLIQTPNLDAIGKAGIKFNNAFVTNSLCGPSRATMLTGKYSHLNGFRQNGDTFNGAQATLPKYLKQAGYYTGIVGKWHLETKPTGFDYFDILIDQGEYYNPRFYKGEDTIVEQGYATTLITDKAIEQLEKHKGKQPVFLMVHQKAPHRNWMPDIKHLQGEKEYPVPETFFDDYATRPAAKMQDMRIENMFLGNDLKLYLRGGMEEETGTGGERAGKASYNWFLNNLNSLTPEQRAAWESYYKPITEDYYAKNFQANDLLRWKYQRYMNDYLKCIQSVDENVGRLLQYLRENDMEKNTLVIYTSDQGFYTGEHGWYDKRYMYEESFCTPLLMKFPGKIPGGTQSDELVMNLDFAPTILTAAGVPVPADMQGRPLQPLFTTGQTTSWRNSVYYHFYESEGSHHVPKHVGVRNNRYKLVYYYQINAWELFDLQLDPNELKNIYSQNPTLAAEMKAELKKLITQYKDNIRVD